MKSTPPEARVGQRRGVVLQADEAARRPVVHLLEAPLDRAAERHHQEAVITSILAPTRNANCRLRMSHLLGDGPRACRRAFAGSGAQEPQYFAITFSAAACIWAVPSSTESSGGWSERLGRSPRLTRRGYTERSRMQVCLRRSRWRPARTGSCRGSPGQRGRGLLQRLSGEVNRVVVDGDVVAGAVFTIVLVNGSTAEELYATLTVVGRAGFSKSQATWVAVSAPVRDPAPQATRASRPRLRHRREGPGSWAEVRSRR